MFDLAATVDVLSCMCVDILPPQLCNVLYRLWLVCVAKLLYWRASAAHAVSHPVFDPVVVALFAPIVALFAQQHRGGVRGPWVSGTTDI